MKRTPLDAWIARKIGHANQSLNRADLDAYQLEALRSTLNLARSKSRFYARHLASAPAELATLADLSRLPFTTADDLRTNPLHFVCVSQDDIQRVVTLDSSGTTGSPKRLYFTKDDQALTLDFFQVGMSTFTNPGDRVLILLPGQTPGSVGDLLATALGRLGATAIKHGPVSDPQSTLEVIRREAINVLVGVPVHLLAVARQPGANSLRLKSVLFATDHAPDSIRAVLERTWGCTAFDHYGMTEMGLGGGVECEAQRGYHLREADMRIEIVDPATGVVLPDGEYGEVVFTTLTRRGEPLIRYRTGDISRFIPGPCPCGTVLKTLERVTHRFRGRVPIGNSTLTIADLDRVLFAIDAVVNYSASINHAALHLDVQLKPNHPIESTALLSRIRAAFPSIDLRLTLVDHIPLSMAKRVISNAVDKSYG